MMTDKEIRLECLKVARSLFEINGMATGADIANILGCAQAFSNMVIAERKPRPSIIEMIFSKAANIKAYGSW